MQEYTSLEGSSAGNLYSQYPQQFQSAWYVLYCLQQRRSVLAVVTTITSQPGSSCLGCVQNMLAIALAAVMHDVVKCRASQQLDLLSSLQSFMLAPQVSRCGGHAHIRELQTPSVTSSMTPLVVSYLASARLASLPTAFDGFSQVSRRLVTLLL